MRIYLTLLTLAAWLAVIMFGPQPARADEPVLSVTGSAGPTWTGGEATYSIELLNHADRIVYDGVLSITLPAGFSYVPGSTVALGEGWPLVQQEPVVNGQTITWGPYHLPSAGITAHNPFGIHTMVDSCPGPPGLHLDGAKMLIGNGGYVTQLFYGIDAATTGPSEAAINYVFEAYARNLIPILRLQGHYVNGVWQAPHPGPQGDYADIARAYANFVAGLPRRNTNPLYIAVWNEPNLGVEWSGAPNATQYARFFVAVSNAVRGLGDARIRLVNGAVVPSDGYKPFLNQMLATRGFINAFDVWASHCYPYNHPPAYNNHQRTARYSEYAIDCYTHELALLNNYGRRGVKVMLTETGYELGNKTFKFEGFSSAINESNRAAYIASALADYWSKWPEIVAVTPFELCDASGHWANFDWVYPYPPYPVHAQFNTVAALTKPVGKWQPYGYQITFRARADAPPGIYHSRLEGREREGHTALSAEAAPVQVFLPGQLRFLYLPLLQGRPSNSNTGPWY